MKQHESKSLKSDTIKKWLIVSHFYGDKYLKVVQLADTNGTSNCVLLIRIEKLVCGST